MERMTKLRRVVGKKSGFHTDLTVQYHNKIGGVNEHMQMRFGYAQVLIGCGREPY